MPQAQPTSGSPAPTAAAGDAHTTVAAGFADSHSFDGLGRGDEALRMGGQLLGPWRLLRLLGQGGMAQVWLAEKADGAHVRQVALKLPHANANPAASTPQARVIVQRFLRERAIFVVAAPPAHCAGARCRQ